MGAFTLEESEGGPTIVNSMPESRRRNSDNAANTIAAPMSVTVQNTVSGAASSYVSPPVAVTNSNASGDNAATGADVLIKNDNTDWINRKWRPAMGWIYMLTCTADFVIFPILWSALQAVSHGQVTSQWQPLTLQGAGLYHLAMGAVIGITSYGRTKEKLSGSS